MRRAVDSGHKYNVRAKSSNSMRITSQNGGEQGALCCSVDVMNIWSSHIARLLVVAWGGNMGAGKEWLAVQTGWVGRMGGGGQWRWQQPILRLAAGSSVNESRAGHVWVGRRDFPAAETDATVVRLNFFCQAPPNTGQKQTQTLVARVGLSEPVCLSTESVRCLVWYQALTGASTSRAVMVCCSASTTFFFHSLSHFLLPISHYQSF